MTAFLSELVSYVLKFAILFACSAAGIYFGTGRAKAKKKEAQNTCLEEDHLAA